MAARRCYVLGAGFSKCCGLPLAKELTEFVLRHVEPEHDSGSDRYLGPIIAQLKSFLHRLYPTCDFNASWPDFEELCTLLDEWDLFGADMFGTPTSKEPMEPARIKKTLLRHLALALCDSIEACTPATLTPVCLFVKKVSDAGDFVISFNWDTLIEVAAADIGADISYGGIMTTGVQVAKPHGSINLAAADKVDFDRLRRNSINVRDVLPDYEYDGRVVIRALSPRDAANRIRHPFAASADVLVEPNTRKTYKSAWLKLQWKRAIDFVQHANEIVVIGFSLPRTDIRPRVLFQLAGLRRPSPPKVIIVSPDATDLAKHYTENALLDVEALGCTFEEWVLD